MSHSVAYIYILLYQEIIVAKIPPGESRVYNHHKVYNLLQIFHSSSEDVREVCTLTLNAPPVICSRRQCKILPIFKK